MSVLSDLSTDLEAWTGSFANAVDAEAVAENRYLLAFHSALAQSEAPTTTKVKLAEGEAVEPRCAWNLTVATRKACWAKVESLRARLSAAQSHQRFVRGQDGGPD